MSPFSIKPELQRAQTFGESQRLQFDIGQDMQPIPVLVLNVCPARQQPSALPGRRLKVGLQRAHLSVASHLRQFKEGRQETQPTVLDALIVKSS